MRTRVFKDGTLDDSKIRGSLPELIREEKKGR